MSEFNQRLQQVESQYNAGGDINLYQPALSLTERQRKRNRTLMLERVQTTWIEGVLEPSLQGAAPIALDLQSKPSATVTPFWQVLREFDHTALLPQSLTTLLQVYDHARGEVLILGEPGAGKTTLLLELTRDLLARARQDEMYPIPVVFNLSSWVLSRQPLDQWLVTELHARYQIPLPVATFWVETDQVFPLLDGLDEVTAPYHVACVEAINAYRRAHGLLPTVVCCRKADYFARSLRLLLRTAVVVQPLTEQQIQTYLSGTGEQMAVLRQALHEDAELRTLASTPLMLNVLTVAYQGISPQERAIIGSLDLKREQIFASYVQRMLNRRGSALSCMREQTMKWLTILARQMQQRGQTVFYIEQMQPDWLPDYRWSWGYDMLAVLLPGILIGILMSLLIYSLLFSFSNVGGYIFSIVFVGGLIGGLFSGSQRVKPPEARKKASGRSKWHHLIPIGPLCWGLLVGLGIGLSYQPRYYGLAFGLSSTLLCFFFEKWNRPQSQLGAHGGVWNNIWVRLIKARHLRNGLLCLGLFGLDYLFYESSQPSDGGCQRLGLSIDNVLNNGVPHLLACGLIGILLSIILIEGNRNVRPTEIIVWSWRSLWRSLFNRQLLIDGLFVGGILGLLVGPSWGAADGLHCDNLGYHQGFAWHTFWSQGLSSWLSYSLCYWLLVGLIRGVASNTLEERHRLMPNQGIRNSFHNGIMLGLISAMVGLFVYCLSNITYILLGGQPSSKIWLFQTMGFPANSLFLMVASGLLMGLLMGGLACLRHAMLRLLLWRAGLIPWNYVHFLDAAASSILLRKVGGGYIFLHRLLLDYFATLKPTNLPLGGLSQASQGATPTLKCAKSRRR